MKNKIRLAVVLFAAAYIFPYLEPYMIPYISSQLICFIIIWFILFLLVYARSVPRQEKRQRLDVMTAVEPKQKEDLPPQSITQKESAEKLKALGERFEEYIVRTINKADVANNFKLIEWRSDKYLKDIHCFPISSLLPDLEYLHIPSGKKVAFECKWRYRWQKTQQGEFKIDIVDKKKQMKIIFYKEYDQNPNVTTYIAIGIGWKDKLHRPLSIRYIPLSKIGENYNLVTKSWLEQHGVSLSVALTQNLNKNL